MESNVSTLVTSKSACLTTLAALVLAAAPAQGTAQEPVPAVWKERKLSFHYNSSLAVYTCNALRGRVADLMRAVGARDDIRVSVNNCDDSVTAASGGNVGPSTWNASRPMSPQSSFGDRRPDTTRRQTVVVMITAMLPTQVTPEVLAELEKDKERRELIARVSGNPAARFADPVIFPAERQQVTLSRKTLKLQPHECELLDEMATSVFRDIGVEVVRRNANCDRTEQSLMPPEMVVETLMAAKPKPLLQDEPQDAGDAEPAPAPVPATPPEAPAPSPEQ
jgi:hypothetical protein